MKNANRCLTYVFAVLTLLISVPAHSAYQYTLISPNFQLVQNDFTSGPTLDVTTSSFLKVVITSDVLLEANQENPLSTATYDFTVEGFSNRALSDDIEFLSDTLLVISQLNIYAVDENSLPTSWYLSYSERYFRDPYRTEYTGPGYITSNEASLFAYVDITQINGTTMSAYGPAGEWQLTQTTPVPEAPEYMMFLAGLGLLGFIGRKKNTKSF
ncbi:MAG: hypothetical protein ACXW1P_03185 [Methylophilaceae bacterium]